MKDQNVGFQRLCLLGMFKLNIYKWLPERMEALGIGLRSLVSLFLGAILSPWTGACAVWERFTGGMYWMNRREWVGWRAVVTQEGKEENPECGDSCGIEKLR